MKIKEINSLSSEEQDFFKKSKLYSISHSNYKYCDIHLEYYKEYFSEKGMWNELSLLAYDNFDCYICMYFFCNGSELSFFGSPIDVFSIDEADVKVLARAYQELFAKIESFKVLYNVHIIKFSNNKHFVFKYYSTEGYKESISYNSYVDLNNTEDEIFMNIRKSYKSLINWGKRNLEIRIYDQQNISQNIMEEFEQFHIEVSKFRSRSHRSWMLQYAAVKRGMGYVLFAYLDNKLVSAILVLSGQKECFYGVSVNQRDLMADKLPLGHNLLLTAIFEAKRKGYRRFNIGDVTDRLDSKANDIVKYQRGFNNILDARLFFEARI